MSALRNICGSVIKVFSVPNMRFHVLNNNNYCSCLLQKNNLTVTEHIKTSVESKNLDYELTDDNLMNISRNLTPSYNIATYVNHSKTLQKLVDLGVNLSKFDKDVTQAEFVVKLDFDKDVKPYILFLYHHGVSAADIGDVLTKNIDICKETIDDLNARVNYLEYRNFTPDNIKEIILRNPRWMSTPVKIIDSRLGWMQANYKLTGNEVRLVVNSLPQIVTFNINTIKLNNFVFEEEMGMSKGMVKKLLLLRPKLFIKSQRSLLSVFDYVHKEMAVPVDRIYAQPDILLARKHTISERHQFLQSLGRAQYNPLLPGYISLDSLIQCDDSHFATEIAKSSLISFNLYLKTL